MGGKPFTILLGEAVKLHIIVLVPLSEYNYGTG